MSREMKHSGIDWIGEIPEGWDVVKIGFLFENLDSLRKPISAEQRERNNPQYDYEKLETKDMDNNPNKFND